MTSESAKQLVDDLRAGQQVNPTRGAPLCTFRQTERILAGFADEREGALAASGVGGEPTLVGLKIARERGWQAPSTSANPAKPASSTEGE